MADLTLSQFLRTVREHYIERTGMDPESCDSLVVSAIESWEDADEPVEMTEACAHAVALADLEHWTD
jgi:hypothetical protein